MNKIFVVVLMFFLTGGSVAAFSEYQQEGVAVQSACYLPYEKYAFMVGELFDRNVKDPIVIRVQSEKFKVQARNNSLVVFVNGVMSVTEVQPMIPYLYYSFVERDSLMLANSLQLFWGAKKGVQQKSELYTLKYDPINIRYCL